MKIISRFLFALLAILVFSVSSRAQVSYGPILYQDDFSTSNSLWRFNLVETRGNQTAIDASYGKIEGGVLALKANVGCGWDYLGSIASLQLPLPTNYVIEYRARKMQWCGSFRTDISEIPGTVGDSHFNPPAMEFGMAGSWFGQLCAWRTWEDQTCIPPTTTSQVNGQWYNWRIVKIANSCKVYLDGNLQWAYSGPLLSGGFLHFGTGQAGSTAEVDDLKIYGVGVGPALQIEVAAVRVSWLAESNVTYQVQWSSQLHGWTNLVVVVGTGAQTNIVDWVSGERRFYRLVLEPGLSEGLLAYYPFSGNAHDETSNQNHATVLGATLTTDRFGRADSAYQFNGADQYLSAPHQPYLNLTNGDFTIALWALANDPGAGGIFIGKDDGGGNQQKWIFVLGGVPDQEPGMRVHFHVNPPPQWHATALWMPASGTWHHYVARKAGTDCSIFIDGNLASTPAAIGSISSGITAPLTIGQAEGGGWLNGRIDDIRIYNRALSDAQVQALLNLQE
jgi:hypothetical protein